MGKKKPVVLLVNPPIYDFSAYDFWLKPYGLLRAAGRLRGRCELKLFDYMDRWSPDIGGGPGGRCDAWGRGPYPKERCTKPAVFGGIPRYYCRHGRARADFQRYLAGLKGVSAVLIQTVMTYWYPGVREVIEDVRRYCPEAKIVLGGFYATCCAGHVKSLGADVVVEGGRLGPVYEMLGIEASEGYCPPAWELYPVLKTAVMTLTEGCPFRCSYCYVPQSGVRFGVRPTAECIADLEYTVRCGAEDAAFYDDALLFEPEKGLYAFLEAVLSRGLKVNFHTPNAMHARFVTAEAAQLMVKAGFKTFYLGFESHSEAFHHQTGAKVEADDLAAAVEHLRRAGADMNEVTAYEILGHPRFESQHLEGSMRFASGLGVKVMLSDFSPIPGTPDGEACRGLVDLDEPLTHNKTAFPIRLLGIETVDYYKELCRALNRNVRKKYAK